MMEITRFNAEQVYRRKFGRGELIIFKCVGQESEESLQLPFVFHILWDGEMVNLEAAVNHCRSRQSALSRGCSRMQWLEQGTFEQNSVHGWPERKCLKCNSVKAISMFTADRSCPSGLSRQCKNCLSDAKKVFRRKYPDTVRIQKERERQRYHDDLAYRDKVLESSRERSKRDREKISRKANLRYANDQVFREAVKRRNKKSNINQRIKLADWYVRGILISGMKIIRRDDIHDSLVQAKREHLMLRRALKQEKVTVQRKKKPRRGILSWISNLSI